MRHQSLAHFAVAALDQAKDTGMHPLRRNRGVDRLGHDFSRAGMGGMALHHHRTARCQCRRRIAPRRGKGEREVRRAKDSHRPNRALDHADFGPGQGLPVRQRRIMAPVQIRALFDMVGKQPKLPRRPPAFAIQPRLGQAGFLTADLGDLRGPRFDLIGNRAQQRRPFRAR